MKKLFALSLVLFCAQFSFAQQDLCEFTQNSHGISNFVVTDDISSITIQAKGGDGGYGKVANFLPAPFDDVFLNDCRGDGGIGATTTATFNIGDGPDQIPQGSLIRTIVGQRGESRYNSVIGGAASEYGGGGGGTGVLYRAPGSSDWQILLAAGGGGGGYTQMLLSLCSLQDNGGGGNAGTDGGDGGGNFGGNGGYDGYGGREANSFLVASGAGGGVYGDGDGTVPALPCEGTIDCPKPFCTDGLAGLYGYGYYAGGGMTGEGGNEDRCFSWGSDYHPQAEGGFGFGGGGSGASQTQFFGQGAGGGGGGYSGGGAGGGQSAGGGGGSYIASMGIEQDIILGGRTGYPQDGFVSISCGGSQFSDCPGTATLYTDAGEAFATSTLAQPTAFDNCNVPGNALSFDGQDDFVDLGNINEANFGTGDFTIEFWMNTANTPVNEMAIISKRAVCACANFWDIILRDDGRVYFQAMQSECANLTFFGTSTPVNDGAWHHIAVTRASGALTMYLDGALSSSSTPPAITDLNNGDPVHIGKSACSKYGGQLDEVRIWSVAKTAAQIQASMNCEFTSKAAGLEAVYNFNTGTAGGDNEGSYNAFDDAGGNHGELFNFALSGPTSNWVKGNPWSTLIADVPVSYSIGNTTLTWTLTDENGVNSYCTQNIIVYDPEPPVISCAPEQLVSIDFDQCQPQVILSEPTVSDNGHPRSNALDFDGIDDFVDLGEVTETNFGTDDFTIEFWMKAASNPSGTQSLLTPIISKRAVCDCVNLWNVVLSSDDGKVYFEAYDSACTSAYFQSTAVSVNDGNWHHIAIRRLNAELAIYLDGFLSSSETYPVIIDLNNADPLRFGKSACSYFNGQLDEVRIWDVARSDFEINSNMNSALGPQPDLIVMQGLNEGVADGDNTGIPPTAVDSSGNNHDGTLNNFDLIGNRSNWVSRFRAGLSVTNDSPGLFPIGETIVTWTATDGGGNSATCTQNIVVTDDVAPVISCPADLILETDPGESFATATILPPAATDNCSELGYALNFDGIDDRVTISNPVDSVFTIEAWIKTSATSLAGVDAYQGNGILWSDVAFDANDFTLAILNDHLSFYDGAGNISTEGTTILNDGVWHHIAVVRNGVLGTTSLYVDGMLDGSNTCNNVELNANPAIVIGGNPFGGHFNGSIDEVRIWSGALSEAAIQTYMDRSLSSEIGLAASYPFNQGVAGGDNTGLTTASDASGNGNDGTLSGFGLIGPSSNWVDNSEMTFTNDAPETFPIGSTTVTWTATDPSGNSSTCQFDVVVNRSCSVFETAPVDLTKSFNPVNGVQDRVQLKWFKASPEVRYSDEDAAMCDIKAWAVRNLDPATGQGIGPPIVSPDTISLVDRKKTYGNGSPRQIFKWPLFFRADGANNSKRVEPNTRYKFKVRCECGFSGDGLESPWSGEKFFNTLDFDPQMGIYTPPAGQEGLSLTKTLTEEGIDIQIYPNPNNGEQLVISLNSLTDENQIILIEIVDFTGQVVQTDQVSNKGSSANFILDFDTRLAAGMYFVNLYVNDQRLVEKFTVE